MSIKRTDLQEFLNLQKKKKELESEAREIAKQMKLFTARFTEAVEANDDEPIKVGKYTIQLVSTPGRVAWKDAYIEIAGEAAAQELVVNTDSTWKLVIESS